LAEPPEQVIETPDDIHYTIGQYCFNKLPFHTSSAQEHFQKQMNKILAGLEGVLCQMDNALVFGKD